MRLFFKKIRHLLFPRYHYALDGKEFDQKHKYYLYRFKVFADYSFIRVTYQLIRSDKNLKKFINPDDLITIVENETLYYHNQHKLFLIESLRNNSYKIGNSEASEILSGKEIINSPVIIENLKTMDVFKIAYETGFSEGREFSLLINTRSKQTNTCKKVTTSIVDQVIPFKK